MAKAGSVFEFDDGEVTSRDDIEPEACDYCVCALADMPTPYTDNVFDKCCECGCEVMVRPHAPTKPKRICLPCVIKKVQEDDE